MEKLGAKLEEFNQSVKTTIETLLETKGVESRFTSSLLVIVIHDEEAMFNLDSRRYLVEISEDELIDNEGYRYGFDSLKLEDLCIAIDSVIDGITPTFRVGKIENDEDVFMYFEDEEVAYENFIQNRANGETWMEKRSEELNRHGMPEYYTLHEYLGEEVEE